ncbi:MAG: hypothetical protein PHD74_09215 [Candidatus Krumholzibacteria bacterium]|nr:hypothetical protein [Candidatus Krumholzibacteria bacterium]
MRRMLLIVAFAVASMTAGAAARNWYVWPDGRGSTPTIQAAVDSAASGDYIYIHTGTYHQGGIVAIGKNLTFAQYDGQVYIISPSMGSGTCITVRNAGSFVIGSFSFRGFETAIDAEASSGTIQLVTVKACNRGIAISDAGSSSTIWYCLVDSCGTGVEVRGGSVTLQNQTIVNCTTGTLFSGGSAIFSRTIVYDCGIGIQCSGGSVSSSCNDFYLNGADYSLCTAGANDFYTDPKFCFWKSSGGPYWLHSTSPCFTGDNPCSATIGAFTGTIPGCTGTAVQRESWGAIKSIYR